MQPEGTNRASARTRWKGAPSKRLGAKVAIMSVAALAFGAFGVVAPAGANAPNPNPDIQATGTVNSDGSVTVHVSGTWVWDNQNCEGRWGEGWAVDWWGISGSPTPANPFTLTNVSLIPGFGQRTTGSQSPAGSIPIKGDGFFHVGSQYNDETVNSSSTCTDTGPKSSTGSWSATATYPNAADIPPNICVNGYDEHGSEGKPGGKSDISPIDDHDNSIQTNAFNPASGAGFCTTPQISHNLTLTLVKTNDANQDGTFTKSESAKTVGQAVQFRAVITNTSDVAIVLDTLTDEWPGQPSFSLDSACPGIVGTTLAAGASDTCNFTESNYAPAVGSSKVNTVTTTCHQSGVADNKCTKNDTSTVTTKTPPPPPQNGFLEICKQQQGSGLEGVLFTFKVQGQTVKVPVGACSPAIKVTAGNVTVTEVPTPSSQLVTASTIPSNRLVSVNFQSNSATVKVPAGGVSNETIVTFVNKIKPGNGFLKICKIAGSGIKVGTAFGFKVDGGSTISVPAGPGQGYCVVAGQFPIGNHTITENATSGTNVTNITVAPSNRKVSTSTANRSAKVTVGSGVTEVTFTNQA